MGHFIPKEVGIKINGIDVSNIDPNVVSEIINNDDSGILKAMLQSELLDSDKEDSFPIAENYASHAGRPSLSKAPYMTCSNDGMPYIKGHSPVCDGKLKHSGFGNKFKRCWCHWVSNGRIGVSE